MEGGDKIKAQRVEQHVIKKSNPIYKIVDEYCFRSKNMYNYANYLIRQEFIKTGKWLRAYDIQKMCQSKECYKEVGSQSAQKTIQLLDKNWKSFFQSCKEYKKNPSKFLGMPRLPKYLKKDGRQIFMLKNIQCSLSDGKLRIAFKPFKGYTVNSHATGRLIQCRFVPRENTYVMEIIYEIEVPDCNDETNKIASIDLGVENFITMVNNIGEEPIAVKGGTIKSINQYYNKKKAAIQSELKKQNKADWSNRLQLLTDKRFEMIKYQMHCISKLVVDWCVLYKIDTLVIGLNKTWKQENGKKQNFTYIPYDMFINQLTYKCENNGIKCITDNESYTSGTSFLDNEKPCKDFYNKKRRVYRGLFISNDGIKINADVNGAYQIMKKVIPNSFENGIEGVGLHPSVVSIRP